GIKVVELRQSTSQDHHLRIEDVDDMGEAAREAARVPLQGGASVSAAGLRAGGNGVGRKRRARMLEVIGLQARAGNPPLDAAAVAAPTQRTGVLVCLCPGQRIVPPLAAGAARPVEQLAVENETPT